MNGFKRVRSLFRKTSFLKKGEKEFFVVLTIFSLSQNIRGTITISGILAGKSSRPHAFFSGMFSEVKLFGDLLCPSNSCVKFAFLSYFIAKKVTHSYRKVKVLFCLGVLKQLAAKMWKRRSWVRISSGCKAFFIAVQFFVT
jgi:hypothetical protein